MNESFREIVVHVDDAARSVVRLTLARRLAALHGGHLVALYAGLPAIATLPYGPGIGPELMARVMGEDEQRRQQARWRVEAALAGAGPASRYVESLEPDPAGACARWALCADLLVVGQHSPGPDAPSLPPNFVESVLQASGRAALVVPHSGEWSRFGDTVAIAWKPTPEASRAVAAALPLLRAARAVHLLCWEPAAAEPPLPVRPDPVAWLAAHGVRAVVHREIAPDAEVGELLLSRACDLDAELLVMGCYGHARWREWVLGGVSRTVLSSMTVPVLMSH